MRLAISNIAWDTSEDETIAQLLQHYDVDAIDIAPGKYFPDPAKATNKDIHSVKLWWKERGIEITGMQALLFGTTGLNIFSGVESQNAMLQHFLGICRIAQKLDAKYLVFGSPRNRDRTGLSDEKTIDVAVSFFQRLGDIAHQYGVTICLEPNPVCYGANFMMTTPETAQIVRLVEHTSIQMQFDTGALAINNEDPFQILQDYGEVVGHIHASEPNLLPLGDGSTCHLKMAKALGQYLPSKLVSIEMVATKNESHVVSIERSLKVAIEHYRTHDSGSRV